MSNRLFHAASKVIFGHHPARIVVCAFDSSQASEILCYDGLAFAYTLLISASAFDPLDKNIYEIPS